MPVFAAICALSVQSEPALWVTYPGGTGPGKGKHVVFLAGDEEYRSEEGLPQLAKILSVRHGFKCTVLFSIGADGSIDPDRRDNQPGTQALKTADLCVMQLRFREWPDEQMRPFVDFYRSGKPIIALRTSTHAFDFSETSQSPYKRFGWRSQEWRGGFGGHVLGETWVSHWGDHGKQATRGIVEPGHAAHPVLKGVVGLFGTTDVYEARPPEDAEILVRGQVLSGMNPHEPPAVGIKRTAQGTEQGLNDPMMPVVWLRTPKNEAGKTNRILTCTMGAATDLLDEGLRRLIVNGVFWGLGMEKKSPGRADVRLVGPYRPSPFGFKGYAKGVRPSDLAEKE